MRSEQCIVGYKPRSENFILVAKHRNLNTFGLEEWMNVDVELNIVLLGFTVLNMKLCWIKIDVEETIYKLIENKK
jgi:hypothetical protein